jgi:large subunit ribosomal protein L22
MLVISRITADEGPMLRRFRAATMGRASTIRKRSSHLTVELDLIPEKVAEKEAKKKTKSKSTKEKSVKNQAVAKGSK